jgi:hypothetical protein
MSCLYIIFLQKIYSPKEEIVVTENRNMYAAMEDNAIGTKRKEIIKEEG